MALISQHYTYHYCTACSASHENREKELWKKWEMHRLKWGFTSCLVQNRLFWRCSNKNNNDVVWKDELLICLTFINAVPHQQLCFLSLITTFFMSVFMNNQGTCLSWLVASNITAKTLLIYVQSAQLSAHWQMQSNDTSWYMSLWLMGCNIWYNVDWTEWAGCPSTKTLLTVPNATASVPIIILACNGSCCKHFTARFLLLQSLSTWPGTLVIVYGYKNMQTANFQTEPYGFIILAVEDPHQHRATESVGRS